MSIDTTLPRYNVPTPDDVRKEIADHQRREHSFFSAICSIRNAMRNKYIAEGSLKGDVEVRTQKLDDDIASLIVGHIEDNGWTCKLTNFNTSPPTMSFTVYPPDEKEDKK